MGFPLDFCAQAAPNDTPVIAICKEMVRRFGVSAREITQAEDGSRGDGRPTSGSPSETPRLSRTQILRAAIRFANDEYRRALPMSGKGDVTTTEHWSPPRQHAESFVRFLDAHHFRIRWYFEELPHVRAVQAAIGRVEGGCSRDAAACAHALTEVWLQPTTAGGWGIRGRDDRHPEQSPDAVVASQQARCSEWLTLQLASAVIAGMPVTAALHKDGHDYHLDAWFVFTTTPTEDGAARVWNLPIPTAGRTATPVRSLRTAVPEIPLSDVVVGSALNHIVTSKAPVHEQCSAVRDQLPFVSAPRAQRWLYEVWGYLGCPTLGQ